MQPQAIQDVNLTGSNSIKPRRKREPSDQVRVPLPNPRFGPISTYSSTDVLAAGRSVARPGVALVEKGIARRRCWGGGEDWGGNGVSGRRAVCLAFYRTPSKDDVPITGKQCGSIGRAEVLSRAASHARRRPWDAWSPPSAVCSALDPWCHVVHGRLFQSEKSDWPRKIKDLFLFVL